MLLHAATSTQRNVTGQGLLAHAHGHSSALESTRVGKMFQDMVGGGGCGVPGQGSGNAIGKLSQGMMQQQVGGAPQAMTRWLRKWFAQEMSQQLGPMGFAEQQQQGPMMNQGPDAAFMNGWRCTPPSVSVRSSVWCV